MMKVVFQNKFKLSAVAIAAAAILVGCGSSSSSGSSEPLVAFTEIAAPSTDAERQEIRVTKEVTVNGVKYAIDFTPWAKSGDVIGTGTNNVWGQHVDANGAAMINYSGQDLTIGTNKGISSSPDHTTLLNRGSKLFLLLNLKSTQASCTSPNWHKTWPQVHYRLFQLSLWI
jgi:hypothetical protein